MADQRLPNRVSVFVAASNFFSAVELGLAGPSDQTNELRSIRARKVPGQIATRYGLALT